MRTVTVDASKKYDILIGSNLLKDLGTLVAARIKPGKAAIISDSNVYPLFGQIVENSLQQFGFEPISFVFSAGETSKTGTTYLSVLQFLAENKFSRSDIIIALGGGVVGDMAGFAAATYLRGIACVQIPTSLLAMVDSSVGGKTAIDLPAGKNLVGTFYQPNLVICDTDTLKTLPIDIFRDGCAEIIKYSILYDANLFRHLSKNTLNFDREAVISRCVELKRDVVIEDEFDTSARQKLNLGHTIGHAVEALSHYKISHGQAVSIGMSVVSAAAEKAGICCPNTCKSILDILNRFNLPTATNYTSEELFIHALSDKKRFGETVNLILPVSIGSCIIQPTGISQLQSFIEAGL